MAGRSSPPDSVHSLPIQVRPRRAVPVVITAARQGMKPFLRVLTPRSVGCRLLVVGCWLLWVSCWLLVVGGGWHTSSPTTESSRTVRLGVASMTACIRAVYSSLAHWQRVAQTAGPRLRFRIFDWSAVASALTPISPPSASSSWTRWLLARPPIDGLQGIRAIASRLDVISSVDTPIRAEARAASAPACPPPTTIMSIEFEIDMATVLYHN